jgi:hypothetical protein
VRIHPRTSPSPPLHHHHTPSRLAVSSPQRPATSPPPQEQHPLPGTQLGYAPYTHTTDKGDVYVSRRNGPLVSPRDGNTMRVVVVRDSDLPLGRQVLVPHPPQPRPVPPERLGLLNHA